MQMKNEAVLVSITHRDHTISAALFPSSFPYIPLASLVTVMVLHIPRCAARIQFVRSAAMYHYTLNDSTTIL